MAWRDVPAPCLEVISWSLSTADTLAARLVCSSWSQAVPLPQLTLQLTFTHDGLSHEATAHLQLLLRALQQRPLLSNISAVRIKLAPLAVDDSATHTQPCTAQPLQPTSQQPPGAGPSKPDPDTPCDALQLLSAVFAGLPRLHTLSISALRSQPTPPSLTHSAPGCWTPCNTSAINCNTINTSSSSSSSSSRLQWHTVLMDLLALPHLQQRLTSLKLEAQGRWPPHEQLASTLLQLQALKALQLHNCPLSTLIQLPSLPQLQQLQVCGRPCEPIPRSYSLRQKRPLLPHLPALQHLSLQQLPFDVISHEQADMWFAAHVTSRREGSVRQNGTAARLTGLCAGPSAAATAAAAASALGRAEGSVPPTTAACQQLKQAQQQQPGTPPGSGCATAAAAPSTAELAEALQPLCMSAGVHDVLWLTKSIVHQCPQLQQVVLDQLLGPVMPVLPLLRPGCAHLAAGIA